jgi:hypothetical protein
VKKGNRRPSMKIVKQGAEEKLIGNWLIDGVVRVIRVSDTIEIKEDWRPENYIKIVEEQRKIAFMYGQEFNDAVFDHGFSDCLKALEKISKE